MITMNQTLELMLTLWNTNALSQDWKPEDVDNIIVALKKQIPEKAKVEPNFYGPEYYCPTCGSSIPDRPAYGFGKYCTECGQALEIK